MNSDFLEFEVISLSASCSCLLYASFGSFRQENEMNSKQKVTDIMIFIDFVIDYGKCNRTSSFVQILSYKY